MVRSLSRNVRAELGVAERYLHGTNFPGIPQRTCGPGHFTEGRHESFCSAPRRRFALRPEDERTMLIRAVAGGGPSRQKLVQKGRAFSPTGRPREQRRRCARLAGTRWDALPGSALSEIVGNS